MMSGGHQFTIYENDNSLKWGIRTYIFSTLAEAYEFLDDLREAVDAG